MDFFGNRSLFVVAVVFSLVLPANVSAQSAQEQLRAKTEELNQVNRELEQQEIIYNTAKLERDSSKAKLVNLKQRLDEESVKLNNLMEFQSNNPSINMGDQISQQISVKGKANQEYLEERNFSASLENKLIENNKRYQILKQKQAVLQGSVDNLTDSLTDALVQDEINKIQSPKRIPVDVVENCSADNFTAKQCRDKAKLRAEREASEKGSITVVDTLTEIKNFNLTRDEASTRVSAQISDIVVTKDTRKVNADFTVWTIEYSIIATVTPRITDEMMQTLKAQARRDMGSTMIGLGAVGTGAMTAPASSTPAASIPVTPIMSAPVETELERIEREKRELADKKAREEQMRRQAEVEMERIRAETAREAKREAAKQEKADKKKIKRRHFGVW